MTVYPSEVERALLSLDVVSHAFATNVPGLQGDRVGVVVVCTADVSADALRGRVAEVLSPFKVPTVWMMLDSGHEVPRGSTGKVDKHRIREMLAGTAAQGTTA